MSNLSQLINQKIGRYRIVERLGAGGMATVFKAEDTNLARFVAIKVLHDHLASESNFKERFEQEAKFIASFNHPNIVQIYDFDMTEVDGERLYYMVMPYIQGTTLSHLIESYNTQHKKIPLERVREIMLDLCAALSYAHARGTVHRDVKPSNVLFDENERAILTDFGIARLAQKSNLTQEGLIVGTPAYMAPEQATGAPIDARTDLYSLGVILFELLTGRTPFADDGTVSVLIKHVQTKPPNVSEFVTLDNPQFDEIVEQSLAKDPTERYQTATEFSQAIRGNITEMPTTRVINLSDVVPTKIPTAQPISELRPRATLILNTIQTAVIQPARQNPLAFVAMGIALVALLVVARISNQSVSIIQMTATPNSIEAVADSMTSSAYFGVINFDATDANPTDWEQNDDGIMRREILDGKYSLTNSGDRLATATIFNPVYRYENVRITLDGKSLDDSAESSAYGIVFRYQDSKNYNVFAVDGMGQFSIWTRENGEWRELRQKSENWTASPVVMPKGRSNIITINIYENTLTGYVNGTQVVLLTEDTFQDGNIGIYTATPANGAAKIQIESYTIARGENPTESMTEDSKAESMTEDEKPTAEATAGQ